MYLLLSHLAAITAFPFYPNQPLAQGTSKHHQSRDDTRYQLSFKLWDNGEFRDILCTSLLQWYSGVDYCTVSKAYAHDSMTFANPIPPHNKNCTKFSWFEQLRALLKMGHLVIGKHNSRSNSPILQVPTSPFHRPSRQATEKVRVPKAKAVERTLIEKICWHVISENLDPTKSLQSNNEAT